MGTDAFCLRSFFPQKYSKKFRNAVREHIEPREREREREREHTGREHHTHTSTPTLWAEEREREREREREGGPLRWFPVTRGEKK